MNLEKLKTAYKILSKELSDNMDKYGTWEYHELILTMGSLKDLIKAIQDPKESEKANRIYKLIRDEK